MRVAISPSLKQMGLRVYTSFQTPEGFSVSSVYCRIIEVIFRPYIVAQSTISIRMEFYIDRNARLAGRAPVQVPAIGNGQTYVGTIGNMTYLYDVLKTSLQASGFVVEDVIEEPPPPLPEPEPPAPEPTEEPAPEPAPAPAEEPPAETPPS